jgi:hypothetical protein
MLDLVTGPQFVWGILWIGLVILTVTLLLLMRTRWGQSQLLRKCMALSLLVHLLLATYATTVQIVTAPVGPPPEVKVRLVDLGGNAENSGERNREGEATSRSKKPWEVFNKQTSLPLDPVDLERAPANKLADPQRETVDDPARVSTDVSLAVQSPTTTRPEPQSPVAPESMSEKNAATAEPIEAPAAQRQQAAASGMPAPPTPDRVQPVPQMTQPAVRSSPTTLPAALLDAPAPLPKLVDAPKTLSPAYALPGAEESLTRPASPSPVETSSLNPTTASPPPSTAAGMTTPAPRPAAGLSPQALESIASVAGRSASAVEQGPLNQTLTADPTPTQLRRHSDGEYEAPEIFRLRAAPDRTKLAERRGASAETEAAVKAALQWLSKHQSTDGRWDASRFGGGRELRILGQDRNGAGAQADTGVTGLALLAFLGAGHTHNQGGYQDTVTRGIEFLLHSQATDGNLGGNAETFAFMYCHGMATLALSEAFAMTGDPRLGQAVKLAVRYTIAAQNRTTGGWRYRPGDQGDTSQLGWQLMALKSAELAGIEIPAATREGMLRFLKSVSSGPRGGMASYRVGERPSRTMTAEALVCRQFLGMPRNNPSGNEAGDSLLEELPGRGPVNLYYWYYATLGMYQLQGVHWQKWNEAVSATLVASQQTTGEMAGSWEPDSIWGGYGGRVYSTALCALSLEVYYRFLPLYVEAATLDSRVK